MDTLQNAIRLVSSWSRSQLARGAGQIADILYHDTAILLAAGDKTTEDGRPLLLAVLPARNHDTQEVIQEVAAELLQGADRLQAYKTIDRYYYGLRRGAAKLVTTATDVDGEPVDVLDLQPSPAALEVDSKKRAVLAIACGAITEGLTTTQADIVRSRYAGEPVNSIADRLEVSSSTIYKYIAGIQAKAAAILAATYPTYLTNSKRLPSPQQEQVAAYSHYITIPTEQGRRDYLHQLDGEQAQYVLGRLLHNGRYIRACKLDRQVIEQHRQQERATKAEKAPRPAGKATKAEKAPRPAAAKAAPVYDTNPEIYWLTISVKSGGVYDCNPDYYYLCVYLEQVLGADRVKSGSWSSSICYRVCNTAKLPRKLWPAGKARREQFAKQASKPAGKPRPADNLSRRIWLDMHRQQAGPAWGENLKVELEQRIPVIECQPKSKPASKATKPRQPAYYNITKLARVSSRLLQQLRKQATAALF